MSHLDEARYGRACLLLLNVCPFTLRKVIDDFYTRSSCPNLQNFLDGQTRKHDLFHLLSKTCCCRSWASRVTPMYRSQWELLYDKNTSPCQKGYSGDCPCKYNARPGITCDVMDITLCCLVLTNICSGPTGINMTHIKTIRDIRNKLIHASSASLDEITFKDYWTKIETAIYDLAKNVSPTVLTDTKKMVKELETRVMNYGELGELRKILLDQKKFAELEEKVSELDRDHGNTSRTVTQMEGNVNKITERMTQMEDEKKQMEGRVDQKVAQMEGNVNKMTERMTQMEGEKKEMEGRVDQKVAQMGRGVKRKISQMEGQINQKVTEVAGVIEGKISKLEVVVGQQCQEIKQVREEQVKARTDVSQGDKPDVGPLRRKLLDINDYKSKIIPISPLQEGGDDEMPIELLFATVVIREDPKYARKGHYSSKDTRTDSESKFMLGGNVEQKQISWTPTPEFDIGSYNYDSHLLFSSHTNTDIGSTSSKRNELFKMLFSRQTREVTNPDNIFKKDGEVSRTIYMLGDAAHGKTTYCMWLLKKWCNAQQRAGMESQALDKWEKALHEFDFVFLLQFRHVNPSRASVIDMICQDVFRRDTGYHSAIRHVLSSDKYRSLIIMDGLDEWNPNEETTKQLTYKGMPNIEGVASSVSCLISMRPWVFPTIPKLVERSDRVIEILGLSNTGMEKVIENVLLNYYKLKNDPVRYRATYDKIVSHLREKSLHSFMKIPLLAVVCVQIWYKGKQVGDSMASFYAVMVDMLIERADQKHKLRIEHNKTEDCKLPQTLSEKENIANYFSSLSKIGKVAYEGLLSKETNLVFQKRELQKEIGERELQFALDVGLISQKEAPSLITKNVSVHFFHKSIQEFLAAIYIVTQKEVSDSFCKHLSNVKVIMELSNVTKFICGMCPSLCSVISQRVVSVTDSDGGICGYRESPWGGNNTVDELYNLQLSWYRELQYGQTDSPVTDSPVTFHVSDVYLVSDSDIETVRGTRELLSDPHVDIRSLRLDDVPTDGEHGITDTVLGNFLSNTHRTRSLITLNIFGANTSRSVPRLCVPTLRCLHLHTVTINTDLCGNGCPPLLTHMSQLRVLELWNVNLGEGGLGLSPKMVHIERIHLYNVNLGEGGLGLSPKMVHIERIKLMSVNLGEGGLGLSSDMVHIERIKLVNVNLGEGGLGLSPNMVNIQRIQLENVDLGEGGLGLSPNMVNIQRIQLKEMNLGEGGLGLSRKMVQIKRIHLEFMNLGERGLGLSPNMVHIEEVTLSYVDMQAAGWGEFVRSVSHIQHRFNVELNATNIDEVSVTMIRFSPDFTLTWDRVDKNGNYDLAFTRV